MKALILHASAGAGHRRAAEALGAAATAQNVEAIVRDILDFTPPLYRKTYSEGYLHLVRTAPELWGYLYAQTDRHAQRPVERRLRAAFNKLNTLSFYHFLRQTKPDAILCTHFMPLELLGGRRHRARTPVFGVLTDFAAHALWYCRGVARYYAATEEARRTLLRAGQAPEEVILSGIPVMPEFNATCPPDTALRQLGLRPDLPAVLILNGGGGIGDTLPILQACIAEPPPCQFIVVAGRNAKLEAKARQLANAGCMPITVFGFTSQIPQLMDAACLVAGKPGGLTSAEALAKGKPMLVINPIPGQEQRNCEYLLENGCAIRLFDAADAPWKIRALLEQPTRLEELAAHARRLGRPQAAAQIIANVSESINTAKSAGAKYATR